jgi:hypothetical protein
VHWTAEQVLQITLQRRGVEQAPPVAHRNEHIYVAAWSLVASRDRTKHAQGSPAVTSRDASDLIAQLAQLFETWRRASRARVRIGRTATLDLAASIT